MAFISSAFTAGQTLTAASMEDLRGNANAGHSVFTNEAARDAAITAPTEGLMAYLTAPTVPAATGSDFDGDPTGITTIYNGSVWVCTTEVGGTTHATGTLTGAGSNNYTGTLGGSPGTNPSVTLVTGTSALVSLTVHAAMSSTASATYTSVAVSGATTQAASDNWCLQNDSATGGYFVTMSRTFVITGLTAGTNTFTMNYRVSNTAQTGSFARRSLVVKGIA